MEKLSKLFINLNNISKKMLKYGTLLVIVFINISIVLLKNAESIIDLRNARMFLCNNIMAFGEIIVGAIIIDVFARRNGL